MALGTLSTTFDNSLSALCGIHRIQRIPSTEKKGRRQSSFITIALVDDSTNKSVDLSPRDYRIDYYKSSGPGGQHKNKTMTAVRLTHYQTGIVVTASEERSQPANLKCALNRLRDRLEQKVNDEDSAVINEDRLGQLSKKGWTWTQWRNECKSPSGQKYSMSNALKGNLSALLG